MWDIRQTPSSRHPPHGNDWGSPASSSASDQERAATPHHSVARAFRWTRLTLSVSEGVEGFWERLAGEVLGWDAVTVGGEA